MWSASDSSRSYAQWMCRLWTLTEAIGHSGHNSTGASAILWQEELSMLNIMERGDSGVTRPANHLSNYHHIWSLLVKVSSEKANAILELRVYYSPMDKTGTWTQKRSMLLPAVPCNHHPCWGSGRSLGDPQALFRPFAQRSFSQWTNVETVVFLNCSFLIQFTSQHNDIRKSVHAELQLLFFSVTLK